MPRGNNHKDEPFRGKRVLVFGLGILGGGVATTNWLLRHGAEVTVTDLKDEAQLEPSLRRLSCPVKLRLGGHSEDDIRENDIIVFNPDISFRNPYAVRARELGKRIENEATIFYRLCPCPIVAVTGTRGKTTTTTWTRQLLATRYQALVAGNSPDAPLLEVLDQLENLETTHDATVVVNELPSFHLELFPDLERAPDVAVITNLFPDHLNRYLSLEDYARAKANIFLRQSADQHLVLNWSDRWTPFFLERKPQSRVWFFSTGRLPQGTPGIFHAEDKIFFQQQEKAPEEVMNISGFARARGMHNLANLLAAALAAHVRGLGWEEIQRGARALAVVPFRQQTVFQSARLKVINDTTATTPEGTIAAIERFASPGLILISGGTDRGLDYNGWARAVLDHIEPENLVLLSGSATDKMLGELERLSGEGHLQGRVRDTLQECVRAALDRASGYHHAVVLFSPAAKSFEKFQNEFDRGEQFNMLLREFGLARKELSRA